jgi:tol-pal system protein YbgF
MVDPAEQRDFDGAITAFRKGDFVASQSLFTEFLRRYPASGYKPAALFWLGNSQYANRDYRGAIANFRALLQQSPEHPRAPEAVLSIANCQIELKDNAGARRTLDELVKAYPQSEAANAAKERLARLR